MTSQKMQTKQTRRHSNQKRQILKFYLLRYMYCSYLVCTKYLLFPVQELFEKVNCDVVVWWHEHIIVTSQKIINLTFAAEFC